MSQLQVRLEENRSAFQPGGELRGTAAWSLDAPARKIELRLCWFTQGLGISEARVVETVAVERPDQEGRQGFAFRLPEAPLSYRGAMSALMWAVELVVLPGQECARAVFWLSHTEGPIGLVDVAETRPNR